MNPLARWFEAHRRRFGSVVLLDQAIFGDEFVRYVTYRLRVFGARVAADIGRHVIEYFLIVSFLSGQGATLVLLVRAITLLLTAFWWGALERLRDPIRRFVRARRTFRVPRLISPWVKASLVLGVLFSTLAGVTAIATWTIRGHLGPAEVLILVICVRFSVTFAIRTYHSGIYAIRRIYRPIYIVLAVEIFGALLTLTLKPALGAWSLPLIAGLTAVVTSAISFHYITKAYEYLRFLPLPYWEPLPAVRSVVRRFDRYFGWAGLSYVLSQTEWIIVALLLGLTDIKRIPGNDALYLLGPVLGASREWAQLFYFDLKRLEIDRFANLRRNFEARIESVAVLIATICWVAAGGIVLMVGGLDSNAVLIVGWPWFTVYSIYACLQIRTFAAGDYVRLAKAGGGVAIAFALIIVCVPTIGSMALGLLCILLFGTRWLVVDERPKNLVPDSATPTCADWCYRLARSRMPLRLAKIEMVQVAPEWEVTRLTERLSRVGRIAPTITDPRELHFFESSTEGFTAPAEIIVCGSGLVHNLKFGDLNDPTEFSILSELAALGGSFSRIMPDRDSKWTSGSILERLVSTFRADFPQGQVLDLRDPDHLRLSKAVVQGVISESISQTNGTANLRRRRGTSFLTLRGTIIHVFVLPSRCLAREPNWWEYLRMMEIRLNILAGLEDRSRKTPASI